MLLLEIRRPNQSGGIRVKESGIAIVKVPDCAVVSIILGRPLSVSNSVTQQPTKDASSDPRFVTETIQRTNGGGAENLHRFGKHMASGACLS